MSELTDSLTLILQWMEKVEPDGSSLLPGLELCDIQKKTRSFPFPLPCEVQEVYQWRNGFSRSVSETLGFMSFFTLEEAVSTYHDRIEQFRQDGIIWYRQWFPLFQSDASWLFVSCPKQQGASSPVFCYDFKAHNDMRPSALYCSLTSMMQTIVECWNIGAYYMAESRRRPGYFSMKHDPELFKEIHLRYNPNIEQLRDSFIPENEFWNKKYLEDI